MYCRTRAFSSCITLTGTMDIGNIAGLKHLQVKRPTWRLFCHKFFSGNYQNCHLCEISVQSIGFADIPLLKINTTEVVNFPLKYTCQKSPLQECTSRLNFVRSATVHYKTRTSNAQIHHHSLNCAGSFARFN